MIPTKPLVPKPACCQKIRKRVLCWIPETNIAPDGGIYHCRGKLLRGVDPLGNVFERPWDVLLGRNIIMCGEYGWCFPCEEQLRVFSP